METTIYGFRVLGFAGTSVFALGLGFRDVRLRV